MGNYSRFYVLMNRLPVHDDEMKERLVRQYTGGRTTSLRKMSEAEYKTMCDALDGSLKDPKSGQRELLRKRRSQALHVIQRLGVDTTDWPRINAFCRDKRIAGAEFYDLGPEELAALTVKLRGIERRGGLNPQRPEPRLSSRPETAKEQVIYMPLDGGPIC